jgi:hypothetical protein
MPVSGSPPANPAGDIGNNMGAQVLTPGAAGGTNTVSPTPGPARGGTTLTQGQAGYQSMSTSGQAGNTPAGGS